MTLATLCSTLQLLKHRVSNVAARQAYAREDVVHYKEILATVQVRHHALQEQPTSVSRWEAEQYDRLYKECADLVGVLSGKVVEMPASLRPTYENLSYIRSRLQAMVGQPHGMAQLQPLQVELDEIDSVRLANNGVFGGNVKEGYIPAGQAACSEVLYQCYELVSELEPSASDMDPAMASVCSQLAGIRLALQRLRSDKPKHTMDDMRHYQNMLDAIDSKRKDGIFCGDLQHIPAGQARAAETLQTNYDLVEQLKQTAMELDPTVQRIVHALSKLRTDLQCMQCKPHLSADVKPVQGHLDKIDTERKDGVFGGDLQHVPPGQATCSMLLHQCYHEVELALRSASDVNK